MNDMVNPVSIPMVVYILFAGLVIWLALRLLHTILDIHLEQKGQNPVIHRFFPMVECLVWIIFAAWGVSYAFDTGSVGTLMFLLLGVGGLLWSGRFILGDWIAGVVFKAGDRYHVDDRVRFNGISGRLFHLGTLSLTLETDDQGSVDIPYSRLVKDGILEKQACDKDCTAFSLTLASDESYPVILSKLNRVILSAPWTSILKNPRITLKHRSENAYAVDVVIHLIDPSFAAEAETYVRKQMAKEVPPLIKGETVLP